ncbi:hypothetical protein [Halomonas organivorans]|uniref:hypothetical protein n=1 Tax=Halomonas organivorans TaxID=257772 RepID=UPI00363DAB7F
MGALLRRRGNGAQILDDLCDGLGAYWYLDPTGGIVARRYTVNLLAPVATIVGDDIVRDQISLSETLRPWKSLTLRWGRNYSPLSAPIAGDVEANQPTEAARLRRDWSDSSSTQSLPEYRMPRRSRSTRRLPTRPTPISSAGT